MQIDTKPIGGAYVARLSDKAMLQWNVPVAGTHTFGGMPSINFIYVPTAQEYIDGLTVKITVNLYTNGATSSLTTSDSRSFLMTCK